MITKEKIEEISKDIDKQIKSILKFHNLELTQINSTYGDGVDTVFKLECNYMPHNENEFFLPTTEELQSGEASLPAIGYIVEGKEFVKVYILSKKRTRYKILKTMDSSEYFLVDFKKTYSK